MLDETTKTHSSTENIYWKNREGIALLSKPEAEISAAITADSKGTQTLCQLMEEIATLRIERKTIEQTLNNEEFATDDTHLLPAKQQVIENLQKQEDIISRINIAYSQFTQESQSSFVGENIKEEKLQGLVSAYDSFMKLESDLINGVAFLHDLTPRLMKTRSKVSNFVTKRKVEEEDLQLQIARM